VLDELAEDSRVDGADASAEIDADAGHEAPLPSGVGAV
jgi:hypothetical protein